ncbi:MAG: methyltransferase domain-containing protein [Oscillospiraceae bacterium]|nr:methyltransferase domain-containing protein [Oscillospiraceae bacterium]
MFWDQVAGVYDLFEDMYNGRVYRGLGKQLAAIIAPDDIVLECACGTGAITTAIAPKCKKLVATDYSAGMLRQVMKKCRDLPNVAVRRADILRLNCKANRFDKVIAGNVIHLLDRPHAAVAELYRVCKPGGKVIIPTYVNLTGKNNWDKPLIRLFDLSGANFKRHFDAASYQHFFLDAGYANTSFFIIRGRMPCAVAVITK